MISRSSRWLMMLVLAALTTSVQAQLRDPILELSEARRVFVPVEDLDVIMERDKQGVLLPRAKFDVMLTQARANAEKNAVPNGIPVVLTSADYAAQVVGDQLLMTVTAELTQFQDDWSESKFALQRLALEQVLLDDAPALLGRHPDGSVSLFTDSRGKHTLKMQLSTELTAMGSDQVAAFSLLRAPSGTLNLSLPAGKRLLVGNLQLERPAPLEQVADYQVAVGGNGGIQLRITDRKAENAADSLSFATTGYGLHVAPGEVTWHALTTLQVFGKPVDRLSFSVPRSLEIADIESTGLEGWELSDDPNDNRRTNISLTFGQAFDGARKISLKGVMAVETGEPWSVPPLRIENVTSHIGQVVVQYPAGVRLRVEAAAGVRRATQEQKPAADMPDDMSKLNATEVLRFDVWQADFLLQLTTQPKEREVQSAIATVLDVNATGLELQVALTVETHFAPLFELDIRVPAEWQIVSAQRDNQPLKWQMVGLDEVGVNQLRILLNPPLSPGATGQIRLALRRDVEGWPVEAQPVTVNLPELFLPQSSLSEGAFIVRGDDDLDLEAIELTGLDPQPLKAAFERLRFQSQDTRFAGKLKITRKPSRIAAQTVTFGRIDPQTFHTFLQSVVEVQGGGIRTINVTLPESTGTAIRFQCPEPRIVEQKPGEPQNGERVWTLQFDRRVRGQALIVCDIELPRDESKDFLVPQCRFADAERQNGYLAVEAGGEQRLTIAANDASGTPLSEVDPLELPNVFYQPKERIVAVYRAASAASVVTLSEQKFDKLPVPTAVCPLLQISTIFGGTGELQHRATFQLNLVGVQGLHVTLPAGSTLWATLVNGHPVEVRRSGDVYLVPLTAVVPPVVSQSQTSVAACIAGPEGTRMLQLFYRSEVAVASQMGSLNQSPPTLTVESGQRTALPVEVLEQKWDLHYPEETRLIDSHSPLEPTQPLDRTSLLANWDSALRIPTLNNLAWQLLAVIVTIGILALLTYGYRNRQFILTLILIGVIFAATGLAMFPLSRTLATSKSSTMMGYAGQAYETEASISEDLSAIPNLRYKDVAGAAKGLPAAVSAPMAPQAMPDLVSEEREVEVHEKRMSGKSKPAQMNRPGPMVDGPGPGEFKMKKNLVDRKDALVQDAGPPPQANDQPAGGEAFDDVLSLDVRQTQSVNGRDLALLSLAIDFVPPAGSREKSFHYVGADQSMSGIPLEVDYVDRHSGSALRVFVLALIALLGWLLRQISTTIKVALATLGLAIPLALLPLAPIGWQTTLDGLCLGTLVAIGLWIVRGCIRCCAGCCREWCLPTSSTVALGIAFVLTLPGISSAGGEEPASNASGGITAQPTTLIVPFDAGTEPLASERVFLSHEQFLQLYRLANPEKSSKQPAPQPGGIFEALYAAKLVKNETRLDESTIEITARYAVKSYVDGQFLVEIPIGQVAVREMKLDGKAAALIVNSGCYKVAVPKPGLYVIDMVFSIPARLSGTTGSFTLPLLPVPAGKLAFELPAKELALRVNGSSTIFRRVTLDDSQSLEFPIDKGGEVTVSWQPPQAQGAATAVVHVDSVESVTLTDAGTAVSLGFAYRVRQGGIADISFTLPETLRLQTISGPDVGGWELQGDGATRKLRVIFRRNVTDQTRLTIETFLDAKVGTESMTVTVPQVAPQEVTNEIGQVVVFAGNQFSIRAEQVDSLTQIDNDKFATQIPISRPNVPPQLAYRFSKRPFTLNLRVTRQESQAHITAQQAAFLTLRKQQLTTRFRYNLTGAPRSSLSIALPVNFVLLDVQATGMRDYYLARQEDGDLLTIELNAPRLGLMEVVIGGFTPRDLTNSSITFAQPLDATKLDTVAAIWLDEGFVGTLETFDGWRSVDASTVSGELSAVRPSQPVQFAFTSTNTSPSAITVGLTQATAKLSANGLTMVTVTDVAVIYTLALQWQIEGAKTDTLTLTTPNWLAGKLDFQGPGVREATQAEADNNRTRWTIHLRSPISGKYFATATATQPPATTEVSAPSLVFESEQKPVDSQRQYVLLINSSLGQLSAIDTTLVESVQREDVPVVVEKEFVDQATELVRVKSLLTAPKWSLHRFEQQASAPASVNVADLTTILSRDGTYRAQAVYTIKNRSRQFLALRMPEGTELLSVFVAGQPSRAVTTKLPSPNGPMAQLIALPKTSAASLSYAVKIVWRGKLANRLPKSARLIREEFAVPAPQILSQQDDADYGIPVARTRWTVYLPGDLDAQAVSSTSKHNLSLSNDSETIYANAALQEAGELLGYFEQVRDNNRRVQSRNNLKQLGLAASNLKQLGDALGRYDRVTDGEFAKNKAEILKRLSDVEKLTEDESRKTVEFFSKSINPTGQQGNTTFQTDGLSEGAAIANEQQNSVLNTNITPHVTAAASDESSFNFGLVIKDAEDATGSGKADGKPGGAKPSQGAAKNNQMNSNPKASGGRAKLQTSNDENLGELNATVTNNGISRQRMPAQQSTRGLAQGQSSGNELSGNGVQGLWNAQNPFSNSPLPSAYFSDNDLWNSQSTDGLSNSNLGMSVPPSSGAANGGMMVGGKPGTGFPAGPGGVKGGGGMGGFGGMGGGGMGGGGMGGFGVIPGQPGGQRVEEQFLAQQEQAPINQGLLAGNGLTAWKQAGGLSLDIHLPTSGRKLVFTKSGGDPKLALAIRPQESVRWGMGLIWSAVWALIAATILFTLRKPSGLRRMVHMLPFVTVVFGILGFCVLPGPLNAASFVLFLVGAIVIAWNRRTVTA